MKTVVQKVAPGEVYLLVLWFSPISIIPPVLHIHISSPYQHRYTITAIDSVHPSPLPILRIRVEVKLELEWIHGTSTTVHHKSHIDWPVTEPRPP